MNAEQLWETTMDPGVRTLLQVSQGDGAAADEMFSLLIGDVVEPRKHFIQAHAREGYGGEGADMGNVLLAHAGSAYLE